MLETEQQLDVFQWLSPSYWEVKSQLQAVTNQRHKDTLSWLLELPEIERWQNSHPGSHERFLWIKGYPGAGKSVMAGFLIDKLTGSVPNSIVTYFFCKRGEAKLTDMRDIMRTVAYMCVQGSHQVK